MKLLGEYMIVGNDTNGYVQIPKDFTKFNIADISNDITAYANGDHSMKVNLISLGEKATLKATQQNLEEKLKEQGQSPSISRMNINDDTTVQIYTYYSDGKTHLYVYLIETDIDITYLSIEFIGDQADVHEAILQSFSKTDFSKQTESSEENTHQCRK